MSKKVLTDRGLRALKPAKTSQRYDVMDAVVPGLGVRVTDKGTKTFVLVARYPGSNNPARRAIGEYGAIGLEQARAKARDWHELIAKGVDPREQEQRQELAEQRKRANSFTAVAEDFIREKLSTERRGGDTARDLHREFIPRWGKRSISDITPHDVRALVLEAKARGTPYMAHSLLATARRLFGWAIDQQVYGIEMSPCDRLKPRAIIGEKRPRSRVLSDDELRAFWRATARMSYPFGPACRMLLLSGQRHREVTESTWAEFDIDRRLWSIGAERFKSDAPHQVPLTDDMVALLQAVPRFRKGANVFSTTFGEKPTRAGDKIKQKVDARMLRTLRAMARLRGDDPALVDLKPWVLHDLRRTMRTHLAALRVQDHVAEMTLGHGRQGLQRVYDQHRYIDEMRDALTLWAARLRSIVEPTPSNVVALGARAS